ncbi:transketolase family protein [Roseibium aggregatum]|uniref:Transketolase n=1 Tax=Roseibium aggregatum TaxID=187304 RepID=A0A926P0T7_9HYPH|nr:transketolase C-terminal domain-containing protein [Roseibium aggregatum]MBD1544706.1 transketolase [Roseibium aggregatum]
MRNRPYATVLKPYGQALVDLARERTEIVCLTGDLTRQCEIDLFQDMFPERFIHAGMAEANMVSMAGALARCGHIPFVHSFGVFSTRRPLDQIVNSVAYPNLPVRIVGFMPGVSSPGGPSHQAIEDVAPMRAIPNMTVVDVADAVEIRKALPAIVDHPGPVYLRLKRGEIPVIFDDDHEFSMTRAQIIKEGDEASILANGMMLSAAIAAAEALDAGGVSTRVVNVPVIKPLDSGTVLDVARRSKLVVTAENHTIVGGLGSAVAEVMAEAGIGCPLRRIGLRDTFAEGARTAPPLFKKYKLGTQDIIDAVWSALSRPGAAPAAPVVDAAPGEYAPV